MKNQTIRIRPGQALQGAVEVPGDKSISHRALIFGALAEGSSHIKGWLPAGDTLATLNCIQQLGVQIDRHDETTLTVHGRGLNGLQKPDEPLNCVHAGTAIRLLAGVMAGQSFDSVLDGSPQLRRRPMGRITQPLHLMGASVDDTDGCAPLYFHPSQLNGITYEMPVASAQVKSCLLLAGLYASRTTTIIEPGPARDHTERMLNAMGASIKQEQNTIILNPGKPLQAVNFTIPGDPSSAAFLLAAGALIPNSRLTVRHVGVNSTRTGIFDAFRTMNVPIVQSYPGEESGEPVASLTVQSASLQGTRIAGGLVVRMIDEFPVLMIAATQAEGQTIATEAGELRVKETDRIAVMVRELQKFGVTIDERDDGFRIKGIQKLKGAVVNGHDDHRIAMSLTIAGLLADSETRIENAHCVNDSFPGFVETLQELGADVSWEDA